MDSGKNNFSIYVFWTVLILYVLIDYFYLQLKYVEYVFGHGWYAFSSRRSSPSLFGLDWSL